MLSTRFLCAMTASLGSLALVPIPCEGQLHGSTVQEVTLGQSTAEIDSINQIQAMLSDHPGNPHLRFERARLLEVRGLHDQAMADYRWLLDHYPELPEAYNNMARLLALQGDIDLAITTLEQGMATNAAYHKMFTNLRTIYDTLAQRAYRSALHEPESAEDVESSRGTGIQLIAAEGLSGHPGIPVSPKVDLPGHED